MALRPPIGPTDADETESRLAELDSEIQKAKNTRIGPHGDGTAGSRRAFCPNGRQDLNGPDCAATNCNDIETRKRCPVTCDACSPLYIFPYVMYLAACAARLAEKIVAESRNHIVKAA